MMVRIGKWFVLWSWPVGRMVWFMWADRDPLGCVNYRVGPVTVWKQERAPDPRSLEMVQAWLDEQDAKP